MKCSCCWFRSLPSGLSAACPVASDARSQRKSRTNLDSMGGHVNVNLTEGCRCPARLAKLDTGDGVWLIAVANVMETQSGQNLLLEQGQKIADSINYAFDPDA